MGKGSKGGSGRSGSGKGSGSAKGTAMSKEAASRIQSAGARNAGSKTAQSGFAERAQSSADKQANADR
jgi:hypothetical protein